MRRAFAGDVISRGVRGHVPEGKVWGGRDHERHERECWGGGGHRASVNWKVINFLPSNLTKYQTKYS